MTYAASIPFMKERLKYIHLTAFLLVLIAAGAAGQTTGTITELDSGVGITVDLNPRARLDFFAGKERSEELSATKWKVSGGVSFRVKPIFKRFLDVFDSDKSHLLVLGSSYEYSRSSTAGEKDIEHKIMLDATLRYAFAQKILASNRNRFELRWVNGNYHWRYRNRFLLERPFKIPFKKKKIEITPFGGAEAVWDARYRKWSIFKFTGGIQVPLFRRTSVEFLYERQHCVTCTDRTTNIFGLTFNINFRLKRK